MTFALSTTIPALAGALRAVLPAVETKSSHPALQGCLFSGSDRGATLAGTDLDETVTVELDGDCRGHGDLLLPAAALAQLIGRLEGAGEVSISVNASGSGVITSGKSRSTLKALPRDRYPDLPQPSESVILRASMPAPVLAYAALCAFHALPPYRTKDASRGGLLELGAEGGRLVTTDGVRLFVADLSGSTVTESLDPEDDRHVILSRVALKMLGALESEDIMTVNVERTAVRFECGGWSLSSKRVEGHFPGYRSILRALDGWTATFNREEVLWAINSALIINIGDSSVNARRIRMSVDHHEAVIRARGSLDQKEEAEIAVDCECEQGGLDLAVNGAFLREALEALRGNRVKLLIPSNHVPAGALLVENEDPADGVDQGVIARMLTPAA